MAFLAAVSSHAPRLANHLLKAVSFLLWWFWLTTPQHLTLTFCMICQNLQTDIKRVFSYLLDIIFGHRRAVLNVLCPCLLCVVLCTVRHRNIGFCIQCCLDHCAGAGCKWLAGSEDSCSCTRGGQAEALALNVDINTAFQHVRLGH